MLINFYIIIFLLLIIAIVYLNIAVPINYAVFVSIYPYLLSFAALIGISLLTMRIFQNTFIIKIVSIIMSFFFAFFILSFFQIWMNTKNLDTSYMSKETSKMDISQYNEALLIYDGQKMFDEIIKEISTAKEHIHIEFFILRNDNIGQKFKDLLIEKAKEGVEVRIIYDGLGSRGLKRNYRKDLQNAGVDIKPYDNIWQSIIKGKLNYRNHRKIVIVDGKVGFTGGINIGDEYLSRDDSIGNWKDILIKVHGEAVNDMQKVFLGDWHYVSGEKLEDNNKYFYEFDRKNILPIQIVSGGYSTNMNEIQNSFYSIVTSAKESLYIVTPYFVPSYTIMKAIQDAALSGVDVKIILPKKPDYFLVGWVNSSFFDELLKNKIKIYLYEDGFLHAKIFIADDKLVSVGSANLNMRSQYLDYEMNAVLFNKNHTDMMINEIYKDIKDSSQVTPENYSKRGLLERIKETIGRLSRPLV